MSLLYVLIYYLYTCESILQERWLHSLDSRLNKKKSVHPPYWILFVSCGMVDILSNVFENNLREL